MPLKVLLACTCLVSEQFAPALVCSITQVAKALGALPKLQYVDLGFDGIEGPLDSACNLAKTKKLASLNLMNNALTGSIPACFGPLPALAELHVDYNQLTGAIPAFDVPNSPMVYFSAAYQVWLHVRIGRR